MNWIFSLIAALLSPLLEDEVSHYVRKLNANLIRRGAAKVRDPVLRTRLEEELLSHLYELPPLSGFAHAISCLRSRNWRMETPEAGQPSQDVCLQDIDPNGTFFLEKTDGTPISSDDLKELLGFLHPDQPTLYVDMERLLLRGAGADLSDVGEVALVPGNGVEVVVLNPDGSKHIIPLDESARAQLK